jgi:CheY-like chemotaxis protein
MTPSERSTLSILVVEDDPGVADLLRELLNDVDGWGATVAPDAASARSTFQQVQIDVLVLDVNLPGISGLELLALLQQEPGWRGQPVVIISANVRDPDVQEAIRRAPVTEVLAKPFDVDHVIHVIEAATAG